MPEAVIVDAIRTPIGRAFKGSLTDVRADELAATPLRALQERNPDVNFSETVDVLMGSASGIGEQGYNVGRNASLYDVYIPMGLTAENVADRCKVSREAQDEWAVISQNRAVDARDSGHFDREIVPVTLPDGTVVAQDDGPRPGTTMEKLSSLKPVFREDGTVTAGN